VIAGERRWRASQMAGLALAPCIIKDRVDERTLLEVAVIENVQRVGLSAADEARAYEQLATEFGLSNDEIAQRVGKSRSTIANLRGLLRLPDAVLNQVGPGEGQIPQGVARTLSQVAKFKGAAKDIEQIGARIVKGDLTGFDAEDMIGDLVCKHALTMTADWDLKWLTTPVTVGEIEVRDCFGCPAFVKLNGDRYCAQQPARCYPAKRELYAQREIERVSKATRVPIATPADKATVLQVEYRDQPRVTSWLKAKTRPNHLRLVRVIDQPADKQNYLSTHTIRDILKSHEVLLASLDPAALKLSLPPGVHFVGEHQGQPYIVMELLRGRTLREIKEKDGPLNEERALDIAIQVTEGLQAAYKNPMIHGDIKPGNILIGPEGRVKLIDLGLARKTGDEPGSGFTGTAEYSAPEVLNAGTGPTQSSDVYSLGLLLFWMMTGQLPDDADDP
jgi:hypothetical protein